VAHYEQHRGFLEILTRANQYWQKTGNNPRMEVEVAGFATKKTGRRYILINPVDIQDIKFT
jgi:hypothetical protein